jgi:hypothetical protein
MGVLLSLPGSPPLLAMVMAGMHTDSYGFDGRALASFSRDGSDYGAGCRTLGPAVSVLRLLGLRDRRSCLRRWR